MMLLKVSLAVLLLAVAALGVSPNVECDSKAPADATVCLIIPSTTKNLKVEKPEDLPLVKFVVASLKEFAPFDDGSKLKLALYLGVDYDDPYYSVESKKEELRKHLMDSKLFTRVSVVTFDKPAEGQGKKKSKMPLTAMWNALMEKGYHDTCHYFYQTGDDVKMITKGWASKLVEALRKNNNYGTVGPIDVDFEKTFNMPQPHAEQTMVHNLHKKIFGDYYDAVTLRDAASDIAHFQMYGPKYSIIVKDVKAQNAIRFTRYKPLALKKEDYLKSVRDRQVKICDWEKKCHPKSTERCDYAKSSSVTWIECPQNRCKAVQLK